MIAIISSWRPTDALFSPATSLFCSIFAVPEPWSFYFLKSLWDIHNIHIDQNYYLWQLCKFCFFSYQNLKGLNKSFQHFENRLHIVIFDLFLEYLKFFFSVFFLTGSIKSFETGCLWSPFLLNSNYYPASICLGEDMLTKSSRRFQNVLSVTISCLSRRFQNVLEEAKLYVSLWHNQATVLWSY